jgi:hypothetical protein
MSPISFVSLTRVYLDQRDWIALARVHYGRDTDPALHVVLDIVRHGVENGLLSFPLSAAHYIETFHSRDPARRQRLGRFMAELSRFDTIASAPRLLEAEIDKAVSEIAGTEQTIHARPFGRGVAHALGLERAYLLDDDLRNRFVRSWGEEAVFTLFETAAIVGPDEQLPHGDIQLPSREFSDRQLRFERETARNLMHQGHTSDLAHRFVMAQETVGHEDAINAALARHGLTFGAIASRQALTNFIMSLPAKAAVTRLRMHAHENPSFAWHIGDLSDITALGTAAAYCDVVVAENKWGDMLRRDQPRLRARVTCELRDLPQLLLSATKAT